MAEQLVNLASVKSWLNISADTDDPVLSQIIDAASRAILNELGRTSMAVQTINEVRSGVGGTRLFLRQSPALTITSLAVDGVTIAAQTSWPTGAGYLFTPWDGSLPVRAAFVDLFGYGFNRGSQNIRVIYTAGFSAVPDDVARACTELVALRYKERQRIGQTSVSTGEQTIQYVKDAKTPSIQEYLNPYRNVVPVG